MPHFLIILAVLLLAGCSPDEAEFGFSVERIEASETTGKYSVVVHQKLDLSGEAENALRHGVPLAIKTEIALRVSGSRRSKIYVSRVFKIRYLPLSERYQLTMVQPFGVTTYPRLRHALSELSTITLTLPDEPLPEGKLEIRARSFLDKRYLPQPMRLPTLFSSQWQHNSGWRTQPFADLSGA